MAVNLNKDTVYRNAKPKEKEYPINDSGGLYFFVMPNGSKLWRFIYTFQGDRRRTSFGIYPVTTAVAARRKAEEARQQIANGIDPREIKRQKKAAQQTDKANEMRRSDGLPILGSFADITGKWLESIANLNSAGTLFKKKSRLTTWNSPSSAISPSTA